MGRCFTAATEHLTPAVVNSNKIYKLHYGEIRGNVLRPPQRLTPAVVNLNKIYKLHYGEVRGDVLRPPHNA